MKQGFFVRVCVLCVEKNGTEYKQKAIYGCRLDDEVWFCKKCKTKDKCSIRDVAPDPRETTHGYCESCVAEKLK